MLNSLYKKCLELAAHKSSKFFLGLVSFIESSFFPIPPDVMIIPMVFSRKKEFFKIFLIATIFSVLGGIFGYFIGSFFFDFASHQKKKASLDLEGGCVRVSCRVRMTYRSPCVRIELFHVVHIVRNK